MVRNLEMIADRRNLSLAIPRFLIDNIPIENALPLSGRVARLLYPDTGSLALIPTGSESLTDAAGPSGQIRFSLKRRTRRALIELMSYLEISLDEDTVLRVSNCRELDGASEYFAELVAYRCDRLKVVLIPETLSGNALSESELEFRVNCILGHGDHIKDVDIEYLTGLSWRFMRAGDPWATIAILERIPDDYRSTSQWHALAIAHVAIDKTEVAEGYFVNWANDGSALESSRAKYGLAMLYARHHPPHLRSNAKSAAILDSALDDLKSVQMEDATLDLTFDEVFNRNGYALLQVRRGDMVAALSSLREGISRLDDRSELEYLHKSVLQYNIAQIYKISNNPRAAIAQYELLLAMDPNMPEYHCELAACHIDLAQYEQAECELERAVELDQYIPETHSLLGFVAMRTGDYRRAATHYRESWALDPVPKTAYAYAFCVVKTGLFSDSLRMLVKHDLPDVPSKLVSSYAACMAECLLQIGERARAREVLRQALLLNPDDPRIEANLHWIDSDSD